MIRQKSFDREPQSLCFDNISLLNFENRFYNFIKSY